MEKKNYVAPLIEVIEIESEEIIATSGTVKMEETETFSSGARTPYRTDWNNR